MGVSGHGDPQLQGDWDLHHEDRGGGGAAVGRPHRDDTGHVLQPLQEAL